MGGNTEVRLEKWVGLVCDGLLMPWKESEHYSEMIGECFKVFKQESKYTHTHTLRPGQKNK